MLRYNRRFLIGLAFLLLSLAACHASKATPAPKQKQPVKLGAKASVEMTQYRAASLFFRSTEMPNPAENTTVTNPTIREDKVDKAYTVVQTQRVEAKLKLSPTTAPLTGSFQISISSGLPISDVLAPLTFSWQHGGQAMPTLLSRPAIQSDQWAIVTGTLQASQTEWLLTVQKLATDPSVRLQISMTSQQGTITSVKVDPLVQVTQTTYIVTAPLPSNLRLSGYALRTVFPPSSKPACEGMVMTWRAADGQNTTAPGISETITKSTTLSKVGASCVAQSVIPLSESVPSGRYTYTLQANWESFTNQAQAVLVVVNPLKPPVITLFSVTPTQFKLGSLQNITVTWSTQNAVTVTIEPVMGAVKPSGFQWIPAPTKTMTYTLVAQGVGGEITRQVQVQVERDTTKPQVTVKHLPSNPTSNDSILFTAIATDTQSDIASIEIWVNDKQVHLCPFSHVIHLSHTCLFSKGSFSVGEHHYKAVAIDQAGNRAETPLQTIQVSVPTDRIAGKVTFRGNPVASIPVGLIADSTCDISKLTDQTVTDAQGEYYFSGVAPASYTIVMNGWNGTATPVQPYQQACSLELTKTADQALIRNWSLSKTDLQIIYPGEQASIATTAPTFQWNAYSNATHYRVFLTKVTPPREIILNAISTPNTSFTPNLALAAGVDYELLVWAMDTSGLIAIGVRNFQTQANVPAILCPDADSASQGITFWVPNEALSSLSQPFAEQCNVRLETMIVPWDVYYQKLLTAIAAGDQPDVFVLPSSRVEEFRLRGYLLSVESTLLPETFKGHAIVRAGRIVGLYRATDPATIFVVSSATENPEAAIRLVIFLSSQ